MENVISRMLQGYEQGKIGRRQLIQALAALAAAPAAAAPAPESPFRGVGINHVSINVTDVKRSRDFYQKYFGLPVDGESAKSCFLKAGNEYLTIFERPKSAIDHFCLAIDNYKTEAVVEAFKREGLNPRGAGNSVTVTDPDGLAVQITAAGHHP
jgi:catechol-2,3-dioxygenase